MKSARWTCLTYKSKLPTLEHLDWRLSLLEAAPLNKDAGQIWAMLLSSYQNREIIDGATKWLMQHGDKSQSASWVAAELLRQTSSLEVIELARKILDQEPVKFLLAKALLDRAPDEHTIDIAIEILQTQEPIIGGMVAGPLARTGERGSAEVAKFLEKHKDSKQFVRILEGLAFDAPYIVLPFLKEWMNKHPRSREPQRILVDLQIESPFQEFVDLLWTSFKKNCRDAEILDLLPIFYTECTIPVDAITYAKDWLENNEHRPTWSHVFLKTVERSNFLEQINLLKRWQTKFSEQEISSVITVIVKKALIQNRDPINILNDLSSAIDDSTTLSLQSIAAIQQEIERENSESLETKNPLAKAVIAGRPNSVQDAENWLIERRLESRWSRLHEYRGEIIAALLLTSPDQLSITEAVGWLKKPLEPDFESLYHRVNALYERHK